MSHADSNAPPLQVLLVQPPIQHPACTSPLIRRLSGVLTDLGAVPTPVWANTEFVLAHLLPPEESDAAESPAPRALPEDSRAAVEALDTEAFFDPIQAADGLRAMDQALERISRAHAPTRIDRRSFSHPGLADTDALYRFVNDPHENPFIEFARRHLPPQISSGEADLALFCVDRAGQMAAALTLAREWRMLASNLAVAVITGEPWLETAAEHILSEDRPRPWRPEVTALVESVKTALAEPVPDEDIPPAAGENRLGPPPSDDAADNGQRIRHGVLVPEAMKALLADPAPQDGGLIAWRIPEHGPDAAIDFHDITTLLYKASGQGYWNHVIFPDPPAEPPWDALADYARANPNIVHSWCRRESPASTFSDPLDIYPEGAPAYGQTQPLPGVLLWQRLQDPVYIQAYARRQGVRDLTRISLMDDGHRVHVTGTDLTYHYEAPDQLPPGILDEICAMVEAGGSVATHWVRHNLERAHLIAYVMENGVIVGDSSLKHPRDEYIVAVSEQSGIDLRNYLERGYTSVRPEYRGHGIGAKLLEGLTERAGAYKIFSVIAEGNTATQKMAIRNRTLRVATFFSERARKTVSVWIPEWMLPEGTTLPPQPKLD